MVELNSQHVHREVLNRVLKDQKQSNPNNQSQQRFTLSSANESLKRKQAHCLKRGKARLDLIAIF